ncbi:MAG TPA: polysaccharide ABC transporter ATP-binding protein [Gaiellaceae bacterium]|nr:polysaccharide ABC transporter ATP-binding protein [Gaiellaceae bacterium]
MRSDAPIHVVGLGKRYTLWNRARPTTLKERIHDIQFRLPHQRHRQHEIWALRDTSFEVARGEVFGVIGSNGAGKSTLLAILARITDPTEGYAEIRGRVSSLLEVGTGFHPELSGRDNIFLNGAILGMSRAETRTKFDEIVEFSELADFIDVPVKRYSTGMFMRLAFSVAAHLDPEILLLDEVLSVGDAAFQEKSLSRIEQMTRSGRTVLFVSHDAGSVAKLCDRALYLRNGRPEFVGPSDEALERYLGSRPLVVHGAGRLDAVPHEGSGGVRFSEVAVLNAAGGRDLHRDEPLVIELGLDREPSFTTRSLELTIGITDRVIGQLVTLTTRLELAGIEERRIVVQCMLDELPLRAGEYTLGFTLERGGEIIDRVMNQIDMQVLPPAKAATEEDRSVVHVRHSWSVVRPESGALLAAVREA